MATWPSGSRTNRGRCALGVPIPSRSRTPGRRSPVRFPIARLTIQGEWEVAKVLTCWLLVDWQPEKTGSALIRHLSSWNIINHMRSAAISLLSWITETAVFLTVRLLCIQFVWQRLLEPNRHVSTYSLQDDVDDLLSVGLCGSRFTTFTFSMVMSSVTSFV